jgi:hypothetical protein
MDAGDPPKPTGKPQAKTRSGPDTERHRRDLPASYS